MLVRYVGSGPVSPLSRVIAHELLDPTPAFGQIMQGVSRPQWARLLEIVRALLGPRADEDEVALAALSAASQWAFFLFGKRMFEYRFPGLAANPGLVDRLAEHIASSSIAATRAIRLRLESGQVEPARPARQVPGATRPPGRSNREGERSRRAVRSDPSAAPTGKAQGGGQKNK